MHFFRSAILVAAVALAGPSVWSAQDPNVSVIVTPTPGQVTLSRTQTSTTTALVTYASDLVKLTNNTTNDLNRVSFSGTMSVVTPDAALPIDSVIVLSQQQNPNCSVTSNSVTCAVGSLAPGASTSFVVVVKAPTAGSRIDFTWSFTGFEGKSTTGNGCCVATATASTTLVDALSSTGKTNVQSFVGPGGTGVGGLFTGATSEPNPSDPITTFVTVPPLATPFSFTTASVSESPSGDVNCSNFLTCYQSALTIPGSFNPYLTIVLREDAANIKNGTNILSVVIKYTNEVVTDYVVQDCPSPTTPRTDGLPCIAKRVAYKNKTVPGWTPELDGDFEWTLINKNNGTFKIV
jgi:hypothetical protein